MRFQLISDIHLERYPDDVYPQITSQAPYLILAGDIGWPTRENFKLFMKDVTGKFSKVFYIPGNHEYYCTRKSENLTKDGVDELIDELSREIGFINLNRGVYRLGDLKIIGATMWTRCEDERTRLLLEYMMSDYKMIRKTPTQLISPDDTGEWFREDLEFLESELRGDTSPKLVITHHLPSPLLIPQKYQGNPINCGFFTDLSEMISGDILVWCCGHTHTKADLRHETTRLLVNPVGYPGENKDSDMEFCFEV
jgi:predicted phosphodiesterase